MKKKLLPFAALCSLSLLTGCATSGPAIDGSCRVFKPISNSTQDTAQTRREVIAHNKVFTSICKG